MNRLYGESKDGKVLVAILDPGNLHKLTSERAPIEIDLNDADGPWKDGLPAKLKIVIAYSETPIADGRELMQQLQIDESKIHDKRAAIIKTKRPHCRNCHSTIEELGVWMSKEAPIWLVFCPVCGETIGAVPPQLNMTKGK
jgi:hypothetical protein